MPRITRRLPALMGLALIGAVALAACGGSPSVAPTSAPAKTQEKAVATAAPPKVVQSAATSAPVQPSPAPKPTGAPQPSERPAPTPLPASPAQPVPPLAVVPTQSADMGALSGTPAPRPTSAPPLTASPAPQPPTPQSPTIEPRLVELEWAPVMRLGNSEAVRLALVPDRTGYVAQAELGDGRLVTKSVPIERTTGFDIAAIAELSGVNFDVSPASAQARDLPIGQPVEWRWTLLPRATGQHKLALTLAIRQTPRERGLGSPREYTAFARNLDVRVDDVLGMATPMAGVVGVLGLVIGGGLALAALTVRKPAPASTPTATTQIVAPNPALKLETHPNIRLAANDAALLSALFRRYDRVVIESEFRSGYSGARTYLAEPIRSDGRADAATIAKIGERRAIEREFNNFERYVKDTLPAVTARIQQPPVAVAAANGGIELAALRYTFVGAPGQAPISLREALLRENAPALLYKLFDTFGPGWWMQRKPWSFRVGFEYDRMLPAHLVIEPATTRAGAGISGAMLPSEARARVGDVVALTDFVGVERRADGQSLSLVGAASPGNAPLRVRWMGTAFKNGDVGRVVATRESLLRGSVQGADRVGLPDPIAALPDLLNENMSATESTIHGDLNLENALVGPGGLVWLIDFASARVGHPLFDFAHLHADVVAHVVAPTMRRAGDTRDARGYVESLRANSQPLLKATRDIASRCLFNPSQPREYDLALTLACVGALKHENLDAHQREWLYLTAAETLRKMS